jgi:hypothetical protein
MSADVSGETVTISVERLRELEELAAKAIDSTKKKTARSLRSYYNHKEEISQRNKERYKRKKEAEAAAKKAAEAATA